VTYERKGVQKVTYFSISANETRWLYSLMVISEVALHLGPVRLPIIGWYTLYSWCVTCMSTVLPSHG